MIHFWAKDTARTPAEPALIFLAVMQYFVSAKRFTDLGKSPAWAGLTPFCLLLAAAANWFQPRSEGAMPVWGVYPFDALALGVVIWNIVELGFVGRPSTLKI